MARWKKKGKEKGGKVGECAGFSVLQIGVGFMAALFLVLITFTRTLKQHLGSAPQATALQQSGQVRLLPHIECF